MGKIHGFFMLHYVILYVKVGFRTILMLDLPGDQLKEFIEDLLSDMI